MSYPKTGEEVYVSLNLSNTMLTGLGKGTITREDVSVDYLKKLFEKHRYEDGKSISSALRRVKGNPGAAIPTKLAGSVHAT